METMGKACHTSTLTSQSIEDKILIGSKNLTMSRIQSSHGAHSQIAQPRWKLRMEKATFLMIMSSFQMMNLNF